MSSLMILMLWHLREMASKVRQIPSRIVQRHDGMHVQAN